MGVSMHDIEWLNPIWTTTHNQHQKQQQRSIEWYQDRQRRNYTLAHPYILQYKFPDLID